MTKQAAIKKLNQECAFLGISWSRLMYMLRHNPLMFPQSTMEAWDAYLEMNDHVLEDL